MKVGTDGVLLGAWANVPCVNNQSDIIRQARILDVGTGTGILALMMAQRFPEARVVAIDIDEGAVRQAQDNVAASPFADRITVLCERLQQHKGCQHPDLQPQQDEGCYDAIVCNPPFFIDSLAAPDKQRNMARHADTLTYAELMHSAWHLLRSDGELSVIVPFDYRQRMEEEATFQGFFPSRVCAVQTVPTKPPRRYLLSFRKHPCDYLTSNMVIGDETYQSLTKDFYL